MSQLLFFDTFAHGTSNGPQLDLVKFNKAVHINEVRIIPLGARVKADFPGGVRLGATNPSQFEVEFFINDIGKKNAATFESIGIMQYDQQRNIRMEIEKKMSTDGCLLHGCYNNITVAIYGVVAPLQKELKEATPPPSTNTQEARARPPPEKVNTHERIRDWLEDTRHFSLSGEYDQTKQWGSDAEADHKKDEEGKEPKGGKEKEKEKDKHRVPESSAAGHEKAGEQTERSSARKASKKESSKGRKDRDHDKEELSVGRCRGKDSDKESSRKQEAASQERKEHIEDDTSSQDISPVKDKKSSEDHEERHSERSSKSLRAGQRLKIPARSTEQNEGSHNNSELSGSVAQEMSSKDKTAEPWECGSLLPPIPPEEMEAISDDEDLPDVPNEGVEAMDEDYITEEGLEEMEEMEDIPEDNVDENNGYSFEEIMSDEEDFPEYSYEEEDIIDEWEDWLKAFHPDQMSVFPKLQHFLSPTLTPFEVKCVQLRKSEKFGIDSESKNDDTSQMVSKFLSLVTQTKVPVRDISPARMELSEDEDDRERFVKTAEQVSQTLCLALPYITVRDRQEAEEVLKVLYKWTFYLLNYEEAVHQRAIVFKVRHLKAGIRMALALLQCSSEITEALLREGLLQSLIYLYQKEFAACSKKLLIIRTVHAVLRTSAGVKFFIQGTKLANLETKNGYETILEMLADDGQLRVKTALAAIIRQINCLEVAEKLREDANMIADNVVSVEEQKNLEHFEDGTMTEDEEASLPLPPLMLPEHVLQSIVSCLKHLIQYYQRAPQLLSYQPHVYMPDNRQCQESKSAADPYCQLYVLFDHAQLMETLVILLSCPGMAHCSFVMGCIKDLIQCFIQYSHGIRYLMSYPYSSSLIIKSLLQLSEEGQENCLDGPVLHNVCHSLAHIFHAVSQLDYIASLSNGKEIDYIQCSIHFNNIVSSMVIPSGRQALIDLFSLDTFVEVLFPFLLLKNGDDAENTPDKLACFGYAVDLVCAAVKFCEKVDIFEKYATKLNTIIQSITALGGNKPEECSRLLELTPFLSVALVQESFSCDNLHHLCDIVKDKLENIDKFPGEVVTALRIIVHLSIPKLDGDHAETTNGHSDWIGELRYKYATMHMFSADAHTHITNLLAKLCAMYNQAYSHSYCFVTSEAASIISLIQPSLAILKNILSYIVQVRNTSFNDLVAVVPLIQTYLLLQAFPSSSPYFSQAQNLMQCVVNTLLIYTKPVYSDSDPEPNLSKSLWTQMMAEVLKYLLSAPCSILGCTQLVVELLPLPLPIQSRRPLSEKEMSQAVNLRKLWSAHLYAVWQNFHEIIQRLCCTSHPSLIFMLRRMLIALSDLSSPMALLVSRALFDLLLKLHKEDQKTGLDESGAGVSFMSSQTARVLTLLSGILSHPPLKIAVLSLFRGILNANSTSSSDERYTTLLSTWCRMVNVADSSCSHLVGQESILTIFQYMCKFAISMHPIHPLHEPDLASSDGPIELPHKLTGVPHKDVLVPIIEALLEVLRNCAHQHALLQLSLRTLIGLLEHDLGFYYLKSVLDKKRGSFLPLYKRLAQEYTRDSEESISTLQGILELCSMLLQSEENNGLRTSGVMPADLASYVGWRRGGLEVTVTKSVIINQEKKEEDADKDDDKAEVKECEKEEDTCKLKEKMEVKHSESNTRKEEALEPVEHPLKVLEKLVVAEGDEEEIAESLYDDISHLISLLDREVKLTIEAKELQEPSYLPETLQSLFASRIIWSFPDPEDALSSWLLPPLDDEDEDMMETVKINLEEVCKLYVTDFDLQAALCKLLRGQELQSVPAQKLSKATTRFKQNSSVIKAEKRGRPYAPSRGRSLGRAINTRTDPFRSRPPNTSRPPSLHVDDFDALEGTGHQPTGPTGYNKISFGRGKQLIHDTLRSRGRGREGRTNRFFHRNSFRSDNRGSSRASSGRSSGTRGSNWANRGDATSRTGFRGNQQSGQAGRFSRGRGNYSRAERNNTAAGQERFIPTFERGGRRDMPRHLRTVFR